MGHFTEVPKRRSSSRKFAPGFGWWHHAYRWEGITRFSSSGRKEVCGHAREDEYL
jgi:hypothetical protein